MNIFRYGAISNFIQEVNGSHFPRWSPVKHMHDLSRGHFFSTTYLKSIKCFQIDMKASYGLRGEGLMRRFRWRYVCVLHCGSNCSSSRAMDDHVMCHGIISSSQSAATSETVKRCWRWVTHVNNSIASTQTFTFPLTNSCLRQCINVENKITQKYFKLLLVQKCIQHSQMSLVTWLSFSVTLALTDSSTPQCCLVTFAAASAAFWHPQHSSCREETLLSGVHNGFHSGGSVQPSLLEMERQEWH